MISVIIPCRNEEQSIIKNVENVRSTLKNLNYDSEIIIIDDCSSDDTYLKLFNKYSHQGVVYLFRKVVQQGKGSAIKTGWKFADGDYVVVMDADLQIKPDEIETFFKIMKLYDADVVIGNKRHAYSNVQYPFIRSIISYGYNFLVRFLFGVQLRDSQCGFKLFKKSALDVVMDKVLVKAFAFDLEVLVALRENNIRVADAPVYVTKPLGVGSAGIKAIIETFKDTLAVWWRKSISWYKND